ncbi:MAG TPA: hypothetical protein VHR45_04245 [Thermoanaerobaculia bacterium]|nr:hypothetical protein [Thermoanaerobaculia bacterium]
MERRIGPLLLGIYLILTGLLALLPELHFLQAGLLLALLALVAGIFIVLGR